MQNYVFILLLLRIENLFIDSRLLVLSSTYKCNFLGADNKQ